MNIKFDLLRRSFYITFFVLLITAASLFITFPFRNIVFAVLALILIAAGLYQLIEITRIGRLINRTGEILSRSNERDFSALRDNEKNIINVKISNLIEQLEDSVRQTNHILEEKDRLEAEAVQYRSSLESMKLALNRRVIEIKQKLRDSVSETEKILSDLSDMDRTCRRKEEMLDRIMSSYGSYADNYETINSSISKSRDISDTGILRSRSIEETVGSLFDRTEENDEQLQTIYKGIDKIREVTDIINDVAEKASILSLNAAIESAHAGEAGKGFAVVAEEVGVLSNTTAEHAEFINEALYSVSDLITDTKDSGGGAEDSGQVTSALREVTSAFEQIRDLLSGFSLIQKPEHLAVDKENLKDLELIDRSRQSLKSLKEELGLSLEDIGRLPLLESDSEESSERPGKIALSETSVQTVHDEDLKDEI